MHLCGFSVLLTHWFQNVSCNKLEQCLVSTRVSLSLSLSHPASFWTPPADITAKCKTTFPFCQCRTTNKKTPLTLCFYLLYTRIFFSPSTNLFLNHFSHFYTTVVFFFCFLFCPRSDLRSVLGLNTVLFKVCCCLWSHTDPLSSG